MSKSQTRQLVVQRAQGRCEYCTILQQFDTIPFQIEHICPKQHGGTSDSSNLALACKHCNLHKGPNLTSIDPQTGATVNLFDPRKQIWTAHFMEQNGVVIGLTACGRATVALMKMNKSKQIELRLMRS